MAFRTEVLKAIYEAKISPLVSGRKGNVLTSGDDGEISAWFIFAGYRLFYSDRLIFKHYMPAARLTDEYFDNFFKRSYPTEWATYSNYLTVKYRLFGTEPRICKVPAKHIKNILFLGSLIGKL